MRLLLDTHVWLWFLDADSRLSISYRTAIQNPDNEVFVSTISFFETAIKIKIGKLNPTKDLKKMEEATIASGIKILSLTSSDTFNYQEIPLIENHKDPFDRMLLAISNLHKFTLVTNDEKMKDYSFVVQLLDNR